jgi:hypothetical protein
MALGSRPIIHAERSYGFVWDVNLLTWVAYDSTMVGGGGGGGGAVTIANGADVAEGSTTDAAVTTDSAGTVSGKLRGLVAILSNVWDSVNSRLNVAVTAALPAGNATIGKVAQGNATLSSAWYTRQDAQNAHWLSVMTSGNFTVATQSNSDIATSTAAHLITLTVSGTYANAVLDFTLSHGVSGTSESLAGFRVGSGVSESSSGSLTNATRTWMFFIPSVDNTANASRFVVTLNSITSGTVNYWIAACPALSLPFSNVNVSPTQLITASGTVSSSGNNTVVTPSSGKKIRVYYLSYNPSSPVTAAYRFGAAGNLFLQNNIVQGGSIVSKDFGDFRYAQGATDEVLILNLSAGVSTIWNCNYIEV